MTELTYKLFVDIKENVQLMVMDASRKSVYVKITPASIQAYNAGSGTAGANAVAAVVKAYFGQGTITGLGTSSMQMNDTKLFDLDPIDKGLFIVAADRNKYDLNFLASSVVSVKVATIDATGIKAGVLAEVKDAFLLDLAIAKPFNNALRDRQSIRTQLFTKHQATLTKSMGEISLVADDLMKSVNEPKKEMVQSLNTVVPVKLFRTISNTADYNVNAHMLAYVEYLKVTFGIENGAGLAVSLAEQVIVVGVQRKTLIIAELNGVKYSFAYELFFKASEAFNQKLLLRVYAKSFGEKKVPNWLNTYYNKDKSVYVCVGMEYWQEDPKILAHYLRAFMLHKSTKKTLTDDQIIQVLQRLSSIFNAKGIAVDDILREYYRLPSYRTLQAFTGKALAKNFASAILKGKVARAKTEEEANLDSVGI